MRSVRIKVVLSDRNRVLRSHT